jgi:pimeloyl-ACP methyl ester carboxylesterase
MARAMDAARWHRIDRLLARVTCPVLVVRGRHDRLAPADWVSTLAELTPQGRAVTLPAGVHMVPITHATALAAQIAAFHPGGVPPVGARKSGARALTCCFARSSHPA